MRSIDNNKSGLMIPINAPDADDLISGIGKKEVIIIGSTLAISIVLAIILYSISQNMILAIFVPCIVMTGTIFAVKRDQFNETLIRKVQIILNYVNAQKKYIYQYKNIYEGKIDEERN